MRYLLLLVFLTGCATSFEKNQAGLIRACKNGVKSYDDGTVSLECDKEKKQ